MRVAWQPSIGFIKFLSGARADGFLRDSPPSPRVRVVGLMIVFTFYP
jgi:hypothetical protein